MAMAVVAINEKRLKMNTEKSPILTLGLWLYASVKQQNKHIRDHSPNTTALCTSFSRDTLVNYDNDEDTRELFTTILNLMKITWDLPGLL
ncbi:CLUMA_CG011003, isoform A [Clunio marinus]|uniref:CLUMA_CG011003, isoform A n=1 Tax=Clunio marinus TaxID=568069 RepID=A0A1J1IGP4_9DIPT|nr:CLUMA_CG011003, isoform A [Clunio marinus]